MKHGVYEGKVAGAAMGRSRGGKLYVELLLENAQEETVSWFGYLATDENCRITVEQLKAIGLKDGAAPESLIGNDVKFKVGERTSPDGKVYEDIKLITYTGLRTPERDRILGADAAAILFPKPYSPREREPGEDDMPF